MTLAPGHAVPGAEPTSRPSSGGVKPGRAGGWTGVKVVAPSIPAQSVGPESGEGALPCPPP